MVTELLAQMVELTSVSVSDRRIGEPVKVPRPLWMRNRDGADNGMQPRNPFTAAIQRMMAAQPPGAAA